MCKSSIGFKALVVVIITLAIPLLAHAQASRTWVSGVGDDVNPCSRSSPCKTFAGAISKTIVGGEINCLDPGGFGAVTVTKSITIDGSSCSATILSSNVIGVIINITAATDTAKAVRLRGLSINGKGNGTHGIRVIAASSVFVENLVIDGFANHGIQVEMPLGSVFVKDTTIRNNAKMGINIEPAGNSRSVGVWVDGSSLLNNLGGMLVGRGGRASIRDSSIIGNKGGVVADNAGEISLVDSLLTENSTAINSRATGSLIRLSNVTVINNENGLVTASDGKIISFKNNIIHGNGTDGKPTSSISP